MPGKNDVVYLRPNERLDDRLRIRIVTDHNWVIDFVAQYETIFLVRWFPVVRYDRSDQVGHRDLLDRHVDTIRKDNLPGNPRLPEALNQGQQEISENRATCR